MEGNMFGGLDVAMTCDGGPGEATWRIPRLQRAIGYVFGFLCCKRKAQDVIELQLLSMHDHEGTLTVTWRRNPWEIHRRAFASAWGSVIGDGCENVEHEVKKDTSA